jgi:hypothetical protein
MSIPSATTAIVMAAIIAIIGFAIAAAPTAVMAGIKVIIPFAKPTIPIKIPGMAFVIFSPKLVEESPNFLKLFINPVVAFTTVDIELAVFIKPFPTPSPYPAPGFNCSGSVFAIVLFLSLIDSANSLVLVVKSAVA